MPSADGARTPLPRSAWLWIALEWWFLGLVAYHLILEHRAHLFGALPYVLALAAFPLIYLAVRWRHHWKSRQVRGKLSVSTPRAPGGHE